VRVSITATEPYATVELGASTYLYYLEDLLELAEALANWREESGL
jgi:hypothetical protein